MTPFNFRRAQHCGCCRHLAVPTVERLKEEAAAFLAGQPIGCASACALGVADLFDVLVTDWVCGRYAPTDEEERKEEDGGEEEGDNA